MRTTPAAHDRILCADTILTTLRSSLGQKEWSQRSERQLQQRADILLCFCLDFSVQQAARVSRYRQPTVDRLYREIRRAIAEENWDKRRIVLASTIETSHRGFSQSVFCKRCHKRAGCHGRVQRDAAVFGVRTEDGERIRLDPLADDPIQKDGMYYPPILRGPAKDRCAKYGGFICHGTFHRFLNRKEKNPLQDGLAQFWSWAEERLQRYHGMRTQNLGLYLKELEWKYNHRTMDPLMQACALIPLLPRNLLHSPK